MNTSAAERVAEALVWLLVGAAAATHVYRVVISRQVFGSIDTLAFLVVAVLLLGVVRLLRRQRRPPST